MNWINSMAYHINALYGILVTIGGLVCFAIGIMRKISHKMDTIGGGLQSVLRNDIHSAYHKHIDDGYCDLASRDNVQKMYDYYKNLGGNGSVKKMVDEIKDLPTVKIDYQNH